MSKFDLETKMLQSQSPPEFGFVIGPLKKIKPDKLANRIFCLLNCIGIQCTDVTKVSVNTQDGFASVNLRMAAVEDYAIKAFKEKRAVMDLFDLRLITEKPQRLRVERIVFKKPLAPALTKMDTGAPNEEACADGIKPITGAEPMTRYHHKKQSGISATGNEYKAGVGEPVNSEKQREHIHDFLSFSQTSSTTSAIGFEELEEEEEQEEDVEGYSGTYVIQEKPKPDSKSRGMQTSEESSSSGGAEYSNNEGQVGASANASRTSGETSDALSVNGNGQEHGAPDTPPEDILSPLPTAKKSGSALLNRTKLDSAVLDESNVYDHSLKTLQPERIEKANSKLGKPQTIAADGSSENGASNQLQLTKLRPASSSYGVNVHDMIGVYEALDISDNAPIDEKDRTEMVNARTSTDELGLCFCSGTNFYHRGEQISMPVKNVHFDSGKIVCEGNLKKFRPIIGQLVCAMLNSGGGLIYFGVDPSNRRVHGLVISHKYEDDLRIAIDEQIKLIAPLVPTSAYKVNFAKVMFETGHLMADVRVLEIEVSPPGRTTRVLCAQTSGDKRDRQDGPSGSREPPKRYVFKNCRYIWEWNKVREDR